ncbi:MAG: molybdopterin oxidoreductase, iron-sulfur binding subunit [Myxococcales bacterium]|nr:molybdopterin oxidoreductase, iron-sulfur binding subunit [Myxococcales bacterium]
MSAKDHNDHGSDGHTHEHGHDHEHDHAPLAPLAATPTHGFWKSLRELDAKAPWQLEPSNKEFPPGAGSDQVIDPLSRRNFFHLMGASLGLAGVAGAGCRRYEKEEIVPLSRRPEDQTPSTTLQYSTSFELGGSAHALVATSFEGRPIKLDGNPEHPFAGGGIVKGTKRHAGAHTFAQASILHLYDPDRSQNPLQNGKDASMEAFRVNLADIRKAVEGGGMHVLSEATSSPTVRALRAKLEKQNVVWHEYEPLSWDNERAGTKIAFGRSLRPLARLDQCETIVTIDCDIFVEHPASMRYSRDFALSRRKGGKSGSGKMNRLWTVESVFSNTGALADHRLGLRAELGLPFAMELDARLGGGGTPQKASFLDETKVATFINVLVEELKANAGRAVVIAGRRQPAEVHALVARINQQIGAPGVTLDYVEDPDTDRLTHLESIKQLAQQITAGHVKGLVILGGNPVYDAPADLDFAKLLKQIPTTVHLSEYADETSQACTWHVPRAHFLEAWGDARTWDGTVTLAQPLIQPLYGGLSAAELLSLLLGNETAGEQLVREQHATLALGNWRQNVHDGFVPGTQLPVAQVAMLPLPTPALTPSQQAGSKRKNGELEVVYHFSSFTYDGRFANNPWLWETPDFLTKVVWDNYALVSPETATTLGVENDTMITVKIGDKSITLPCYTMPGQARYSIGLVLGGGRTEAGRVGGRKDHKGVGYDTYKVRTTAGFDFAVGATVTAGDKYELANVQDHWNYKPGNNKLIGNGDDTVAHFDHEVEKRAEELVREVGVGTLAIVPNQRPWKAEPESDSVEDEKLPAEERGRGESLFQEHEYTGHRWGMAIDLSTCTGCNACMVACQSENNVPVVGRKEVINNREMHWIRIDRYFQGSPEDPHVVHQPLACQQCENAPCEQVCPVGATSHSDEGLNDMAYNRCIGTRYCANNCPYKVRRFNFLDWNKDFRDARNKVRRLLFNPDVTVRMRGVMEKCTFCVQRIQNAKITAKAQARNPRPGVVPVVSDLSKPLPDGTVETACQMACPTEAIVFGDLSDETSRVAELHRDARSYDLLPEVYTKPRNRYLTRVRNLNPKMPVATATEGSH